MEVSVLCRWRLCSLSAKSGNLILLAAAAADLVCKHRFVSNRGRRAEAGRHICCCCCKIYLFSNEEDPRYRAPSSPLRAYDEDFQLRKALKAADKHRCRRRAAVAASLDGGFDLPSFSQQEEREAGCCCIGISGDWGLPLRPPAAPRPRCENVEQKTWFKVKTDQMDLLVQTARLENPAILCQTTRPCHASRRRPPPKFERKEKERLLG